MKDYYLMLLDILSEKNKIIDNYLKSINKLQYAVKRKNIKPLPPKSKSSSEIMKVILKDKIKLIKYYDKLGGS